MAEAYIVAAARTAGGRKGGRLAGWHPVDLAASVLDSLVERSTSVSSIRSTKVPFILRANAHG